MANTAYYLKRSRMAIVFQIGLLLLIQCLVSVLLPVWLAVVILIILLFSWWMQFKRSTLHYNACGVEKTEIVGKNVLIVRQLIILLN